MTQLQVRETRAVKAEAGPSITGGWWLALTDRTIVSELTYWGWVALVAGVILALNGACCLILH